MKIRNVNIVMFFLLLGTNLFAQTADERADNIQDATQTIFLSADQSYYKHTSSVDNDPYGYGYWPPAHTLETLADAYQRTRNTVYIDRMKNILAGIKKYNNYERGTYRNDYYDDLEWLCLAAFNCYNATKDPDFLDAVHQIWDEIKTGYSNGAVAWRKGCTEPCNNSISNGPAIVIAAKLYQLEGDNSNLQMAKDIHAWMKANVFNELGGIWDSPTNFNADWQFSYNSGMFIAACLELNLVTGQQSYIDDGIKASDFMINYRKYDGGAFYLNETGQGDGGLFKGIFAKWFIEFARIGNISQAKKEHYLQIINYTADYVWNHAVDKSTFLVNSNWRELPTVSIDLSTQTSGLHLYESVASLNKVHVYQNTNYGGFYSQLSPGDYTTAQLLSRGTFDNYITSMTLPHGYVVTVYENDNFTGDSKMFTANTAWLAEWNDRISSIKIVDTNTPLSPLPVDSFALNAFQDISFGGYNVALDIGDYTLQQLQSKGIYDNDITSFKILKGFKVTLYDGDNFTGESKDFTSDTGWTGDWNDRTTSLRVRANGDVNLGGITYNLQNRSSELNMAVPELNQPNGGNVTQATPTDMDNQKFTFTHLGDGLYKIIAKNSSQSLNINDYSLDNGANVNQNPYNATPNQQFVLVSTGDGYYKIIPRISGKLVQVSGFSNDNGANIQQWEDNSGQASGQWKLITVESLGVENQNAIATSFYVYPNPVENTLFFSSDISRSQISIFSSIGSLVLSQNVDQNNSVDVSTLQPGVYFIIVNKDGNKITKKIIKK